MSVIRSPPDSFVDGLGPGRTYSHGPPHARPIWALVCQTSAQASLTRRGLGIVSCLLGQQKGALPPGAVHDVRPDGVAVPAPLRDPAQGRAEGTEAESHIQDRLWQQVNALPSENMLSSPPHSLLPFLPPKKPGFIFRCDFATLYLGESCYHGRACVPL